ncbi:MAG: TonB C-terminal domain-containing protein, partial [Ottowia sp.]|nr:TonB C-terminal domain-containing protein [Ottowia sp.]
SAGYGAKVRGAVRPNIVYPDDIDGNPVAEVEVRTAPDGTVVGKRLLKSSGVKSWDEAVLRAIDKTQKMPRDIDGRVPTPMILEFRPRDR